MKKIFAGLFVLLSATASAQFIRLPKSYITKDAYLKMMSDFYNFALLGSQTPTSGFKVETVKPSVSLKGNITSPRHRRFILNLEVEGGLDNGLMQLLSGNEVNHYFKGVLGFNYLIHKDRQRSYDLTRTELNITSNAIHRHQASLSRTLDTFAIIKTVIDNPGFKDYNFDELLDAVVQERMDPDYEISGMSRTEAELRTDFRLLILGVLANGGKNLPGAKNNDQLDNFRLAIGNPRETLVNTDKLLRDYDRIKANLLAHDWTLDEKCHDYEIDLTKVNWPRKAVWWFNTSATVGHNRFVLYEPSKQLLIDSASFLPALTISINHFVKYQESPQFLFFRAGLTFRKTNNVSDLVKYNYKEEQRIVVGPRELWKTKEGIAYQGMLQEDFGADFFAELFVKPLTVASAPGLYVRSALARSQAWLNKTKLPLDLGLVWSIASTDRDARSLLTVVPYISWTSLLTEYTDVQKIEKKSVSDKFSVGIKFGIPVNLSK